MTHSLRRSRNFRRVCAMYFAMTRRCISLLVKVRTPGPRIVASSGMAASSGSRTASLTSAAVTCSFASFCGSRSSDSSRFQNSISAVMRALVHTCTPRMNLWQMTTCGHGVAQGR
jgi:hypothetical protein